MPSVLGNTPLDTQIALASDIGGGGGGDYALQTAVAPAFSSESTYAVGDYVTHEGLLYKCTTAVSTAGAWNAANWSAVSAMGEMPAPITVDSAMSTTSTNPVQNKVVDAAINGRVPWSNAAKDAVTIGTRESGYVGPRSFTHGENCYAAANNAHAEGSAARATQINAHAEGSATYSHGNGSHAEGISSEAGGDGSHAEGASSKAGGAYSHAEGQATRAEGQSSHVEGQGGNAKGFASHSAGRRAICAGGTGSTAGTAHDYAWGWQGSASQNNNTPYYHTHGNGTFNINPVPASGSTDPATGFWIGEKKLTEVIADNAAPLASPAFTGTPTAPTAASGTNTTQVATTAFVQGAVGGLDLSIVSGKLCVSFEE